MVNYKNKYLKYKLKYLNLQNGGMNLEEDLERLRFEAIFELINLVIFDIEKNESNIKIKDMDEGMNIINAYINNKLTNYIKQKYPKVIENIKKVSNNYYIYGGPIELVESKTFANKINTRPYFDITQLNENIINELFNINIFQIIREKGKIKAYLKNTL